MGCCVSTAQLNGKHPASSTLRLPKPIAPVSGATAMSTADSQTKEALGTSSTFHSLVHPSPYTSVSTQPPLSHLYQSGFITPLSAQFTRNHGKVPKLHWNQHKLHINGLVHSPKFFTMDQLVSMPSVTLPVSVTSGANRAKELNMRRLTTAPNWGAGATYCSLWTGVRLSHLLHLCQIDVSRSKHVRFKASELEQLPNGTFTSSIDICTALNPFSDVLIAYKQNGEYLSAEKGFPLRVIVPGWIGARMVKWLSVIEVVDSIKHGHYSCFENRIFPSFVDRQIADSQAYWDQNQYLFNQLNINSVIVHPAHQHVLQVGDKVLEIKGYAYSGGDNKITRVELSFDRGHSWHTCSLTFPEEQMSHTPQYGKYYCWMFWKYEVEVSTLSKSVRRSGELRCRAWDQSNNTQPREMNWNLLGCGNNAHYIVRTKFVPLAATTGTAREAKHNHSNIKFVHPTVAGGNQGGWMEVPILRTPKFSDDCAAKAACARKPPLGSNCVLKNDNGTTDREASETENRPVPIPSVGSGTEGFESRNELGVHFLKGLNIPGDIAPEPTEGIQTPELPNSKAVSSGEQKVIKKPIKTLDENAWLSFELVEKKLISYDTRLFKFKLPSENHYLGVPVGQHILVRTMVNGDPLIRSYTPISSEKELGSFTLCIKIYFAGADPKHPNGGKMSQFMECLLLGDKMSITGPHGNVHYKGNGNFSFKKREKRYRRVGLLCGGTGITPAFQVMHSVYQNRSDETKIFLLYANRNHYDILLQADLDRMSEKRENIHVWYTLEKTPDVWMYSQGLITEQMIRNHIPKPADDTLIILCGPPKMVSSCRSSLQSIGYEDENVTTF